MADSSVATVVDVRVVLPDSWWVIPLASPQGRERSVRRLAERQFAGVDHRPQLREDLQKQILAQANTAAVSDARMMALSLQEVAGIPVPASLVLHWIDVPLGPDTVPGDGSLLVDLQEQLRPGSDPLPGFALDLAQLPAGVVLRRVHEQPARLEGVDPVPSLVADYWLERPDGGGLVQLAFGTPMLELREPLLGLFDAVAGALRWVTEDQRVSRDTAASVNTP